MRNLLLDGLVLSVGKDWSRVSVAWLLTAELWNLSLSSHDLLTNEASGLCIDSYNLGTSVTQLGSISLQGLQQIQVRGTCLNCASWSSQDQDRSSYIPRFGWCSALQNFTGKSYLCKSCFCECDFFPCELFFSCICFSWAPKQLFVFTDFILADQRNWWHKFKEEWASAHLPLQPESQSSALDSSCQDESSWGPWRR